MSDDKIDWRRTPRVGVFRPDDERMVAAVELLEEYGITAVPDPMLSVEPTGTIPELDAVSDSSPFVVLTSKTGIEILADAGWSPTGSTLACIGPQTAAAARDVGWTVDLVPAEYSSQGLVDALTEQVANRSVIIARSDHGSETLINGLNAAGADVTETVLYRLVRPTGTGQSAVMTAGGELDAVCFTSSLTVEHFLEAAENRELRKEAIAGLNHAIVGTIGEPTREAAEAHGINVDVTPADATFEYLVEAVVDELQNTQLSSNIDEASEITNTQQGSVESHDE
ncbi:uroporphyrinogen-III synthase [Haloquadratum walsbyi]|jgi:uroporphyrinogen-III synthase (EC 4.2.1.75)|uniref:Uroporphyrinogen-III synthase n=1 Tax=Haloquadratum walsbyi J07HQW2 TaxID=1238425 RepID=U1NFS0_9EURY|nr:uroporphyrinogen-III synthase [Haloquadratum walsbyi]ERG95668.1 MAG: uroporphyrinogen-III synthase [Haloquadratum walsbyi J07HQW2]